MRGRILIHCFECRFFFESSIQGIFELPREIFNAASGILTGETKSRNQGRLLFNPPNHITVHRALLQNPKSGYTQRLHQTSAVG